MKMSLGPVPISFWYRKENTNRNLKWKIIRSVGTGVTCINCQHWSHAITSHSSSHPSTICLSNKTVFRAQSSMQYCQRNVFSISITSQVNSLCHIQHPRYIPPVLVVLRIVRKRNCKHDTQVNRELNKSVIIHEGGGYIAEATHKSCHK